MSVSSFMSTANVVSCPFFQKKRILLVLGTIKTVPQHRKQQKIYFIQYIRKIDYKISFMTPPEVMLSHII